MDTILELYGGLLNLHFLRNISQWLGRRKADMVHLRKADPKQIGESVLFRNSRMLGIFRALSLTHIELNRPNWRVI